MGLYFRFKKPNYKLIGGATRTFAIIALQLWDYLLDQVKHDFSENAPAVVFKNINLQ